MASYTQNVAVNQGAALTMWNPSTNDHTSQVYDLDVLTNMNFNAYALFSFQEFPVEYRKKKINGVSIKAKIKNKESLYENVTANFIPIKKPFDQNTVVYYDHPYDDDWNTYSEVPMTSEFQWLDFALNTIRVDIKRNKDYIRSLFQNGIKLRGHIACITSVYSQNSSDAPYVYLAMEDYVPKTINEQPKSGFIDNNKDITFSWGIEETISYDEIGQSSAKFRWKNESSPSYTEIQVSGNNQSITIPSGTFSADNIQWQVVVTSDDGIEGTPSDWFTLTTVDSISSAQPVSPVNLTVDGSQPITFRWNHIIETGSDQSKYELEYSDDNGLEWTPLKSENTKNTYAEIPANTLPAGNLLWHVRTYNSDHAAGNWSEPAGFVVRAAPTAPSISSISAEPRPVVRWQAVGQQAYEISVYSGDLLIYTTGETAGTEKERKIQEYLQPGVYTVRMRVWNSYNMASPWGSGSVTVPSSEITPPFAAVSVGSGYAEIVGNGSSFQKFYVLRDGVPIAKMQDGIYRDYAAVGTHTYVVRGVTANDLFADSEPQTATISLPYSMAAPVSALSEWVPMIYRRNADPAMTENIQSMGQAVFVSGRALPIFEQAEYWNNTLSFVYSYRTAEEYNKMRDLLRKGETVRYRGRDGAAYWMVLTGLQTNVDYLSRDFTLSAQEVDYVEEIPYDMEEG